MISLSKLGRLATLGFLASAFALTQGCAADSAEDAEGGEASGSAVSSPSTSRMLDVPFYFGVPKSAVTLPINKAGYTYPTLWTPSVEMPEVGLRTIVIQQDGQSPAQKKAARLDMSKQLAKAGVLQDGDIALSMRPELANTMAYPHIQMGVTHASLVYTRSDGAAYNIDSPLDSEYVGQFSALHFVGGVSSAGARDGGVDALQIIRPRDMDAGRRANLRSWVGQVGAHVGAFNGQRAQVKFQSDYLTPIFASLRLTTRQTVTKLGQIILEQDKTTKLPMYCSEFAWHMIALSNCSESEILNAPAEGAACVDGPFEPMPLVSADDSQLGLAEGPLVNLSFAPAEARMGLITQTFKTTNAGSLSSGHRAVAEQVAPLMSGLAQFYGAKAQGASSAQLQGAAGELNAGVGNVGNYSPTSYLALSTLPSAKRKVDYVATVVFVDGAAQLAKAKSLAASNPAP